MTGDTAPFPLRTDALVPLESVLCTEELDRRPSRPPDFETENRALLLLVQALADSPRNILQTLADSILQVFSADSAGVSLLTKRTAGNTSTGRLSPACGSPTSAAARRASLARAATCLIATLPCCSGTPNGGIPISYR